MLRSTFPTADTWRTCLFKSRKQNLTFGRQPYLFPWSKSRSKMHNKTHIKWQSWSECHDCYKVQILILRYTGERAQHYVFTVCINCRGILRQHLLALLQEELVCNGQSNQLRMGSASPGVWSCSQSLHHTSELRKLKLIQTGIFSCWLAKPAKHITKDYTGLPKGHGSFQSSVY